MAQVCLFPEHAKVLKTEGTKMSEKIGVRGRKTVAALLKTGVVRAATSRKGAWHIAAGPAAKAPKSQFAGPRLPVGTGKTVRVAVFATGEKAEQARAAGADIVGIEDLVAKVKAGDFNFDVVIASPDAFRIVGTLGTILGPRGLMPSPKFGTLTPDVATAVKNAKAGSVQYRKDKSGILHFVINHKSFADGALRLNRFAPIMIERLNVKISEEALAREKGNRSIFGEKIIQVNEKTMLALEENIPELAAGAIKQAYYQALTSGASVLEAINGELVETEADGSRRFIKPLPAPYKVALGTKRIRSID